MLIKPHHFIDIIKLYGAGIYPFVPDTNFQHDFYKVANIIIENKDAEFQFTLHADVICLPCRILKEGKCTDCLTKFEGFNDKESYNQMIDYKILKRYQLTTEKTYTAKELCQIFYEFHSYIYDIWALEDKESLEKRHDLFCKGAKRYLELENVK